MEVFLVTTGQVITWARSQVSLAQLRQELASPRLLVVTESFQVLTQADALVPSGTHIALIPCNLQVLDQPLPVWNSLPYPPGSSYLEPFDFEAYEDFHGKFRRFPYIEKQLFQLQSTAFETWARYDSNDKHFKSLSLAIVKRTEASEILVQAALQGFKTVKRKVKEMISRTEQLMEVRESGEVVRQVSTQLHLKLLSMKIVLGKMKTQLLGAQRYAANRGCMLSKKVTALGESPCVGKGEQVLKAFVNVRDQYTQFRLVFEEVIDTYKDVPNRSQKANTLLSIEHTLPILNQSLTPIHQLLSDLELLIPSLAKESEISRQTMRQTLQSVGLGVKIVRIKVKERLDKWEKVVREMEMKRELRGVQAIPNEFEVEKRKELDRQEQSKAEITASAAALQVKIASEKASRLSFLTEFGSLIPSSLLPQSTSAFMPNNPPPARITAEASKVTISRLQAYISQKDTEVRELAYQLHQAKQLNEHLRREGESFTLEIEGNPDLVSAEQKGRLKRYASFV